MTLPPPADPERALSLAYAPRCARAALTALWLLDERLCGIVIEPNRPIAAIKLAWWREALERLDTAPAPPEPLLAALGEALRAHGITGARLASIAAAWDILIDEAEDDRFARHVEARGAALFDVATTIVGGAGRADAAAILAAGAPWAAATVPSSLATAAERAAFRARPRDRPGRWPRPLRMLGVLSALGEARLHDSASRAGSPARVARALWLAMTGF